MKGDTVTPPGPLSIRLPWDRTGELIDLGFLGVVYFPPSEPEGGDRHLVPGWSVYDAPVWRAAVMVAAPPRVAPLVPWRDSMSKPGKGGRA